MSIEILSNKVRNLKEFLNDFIATKEMKIHKGELERQEENNRELIESIKTAKKDWMIAKNNYKIANSEENVDYYAYRIKACEVRYNALLKIAKEKGIAVNTLERIY